MKNKDTIMPNTMANRLLVLMMYKEKKMSIYQINSVVTYAKDTIKTLVKSNIDINYTPLQILLCCKNNKMYNKISITEIRKRGYIPFSACIQPIYLNIIKDYIFEENGEDNIYSAISYMIRNFANCTYCNHEIEEILEFLRCYKNDIGIYESYQLYNMYKNGMTVKEISDIYGKNPKNINDKIIYGRGLKLGLFNIELLSDKDTADLLKRLLKISSINDIKTEIKDRSNFLYLCSIFKIKNIKKIDKYVYYKNGTDNIEEILEFCGYRPSNIGTLNENALLKYYARCLSESV